MKERRPRGTGMAGIADDMTGIADDILAVRSINDKSSLAFRCHGISHMKCLGKCCKCALTILYSGQGKNGERFAEGENLMAFSVDGRTLSRLG